MQVQSTYALYCAVKEREKERGSGKIAKLGSPFDLL